MLTKTPPFEQVLAVTQALEVALAALGTDRLTADQRRQRYEMVERRLAENDITVNWQGRHNVRLNFCRETRTGATPP